MKFNQLIVFFVILSFLAVSVEAVTLKDSMKIYAVTSSGTAVSANLTLELKSGSGNVWSDTNPLVGTSTQSAERTAVLVAKKYSSEAGNFDYFFNIDSDASIVEGPSAGAAMTLLSIVQLEGKSLPSNVGMTGTISEDGKVGAVGGVFEKTKEASQTGIKLFMIPKGEGSQTVKLPEGVQTVYLPEYAAKNWSIKVVEVSDIDEAKKLAFSDISKIDVNSSNESVKEYTPEEIQFHPSLQIMKTLATKYIDDANISLAQARNSLSSTLIDDTATIEFLLSTLNSADKSLFQAKELNENNYLYSAANLSFLAKVYTSLVKDVAENPSLLSADSTLFDIKTNDLKNEIKTLKNSLNQNVPIDSIEWYIAAHQRLSWSELKINDLQSKQTVQISVNGQPVSQQDIAFKRIEDYEFALAWFSIAEDFYHQTQSSKNKAKISSMKNFEETPKQFIVQAENGLSTLPEDGQDDAKRRLNAGILESNNGWFLASMIDASTSASLINAEIISKDKSQQQLQSMLEDKVSVLEKNLASSKYSNEWSHLYLDHAKYFLNSAKFYHNEGFESKSSENLKNGLTLALFAETTFNAMKQINEYYASIPKEELVDGGVSTIAQTINSPIPIELLILLILVAIFLFLFAIMKFVVVPKKELGYDKEIGIIDSMKQKVNEALDNKKISEIEHARLMEKYKLEQEEVKHEFIQSSDYLLEIDLLVAEIKGYKHSLNDLQKQFKSKNIPAEHYNRKLEELTQRIEQLQIRLKNETKLMKEEKEKISTVINDLKKETQSSISKKSKFAFGKKE